MLLMVRKTVNRGDVRRTGSFEQGTQLVCFQFLGRQDHAPVPEAARSAGSPVSIQAVRRPRLTGQARTGQASAA